MMDETALVTGAGGLVGSAIVEALLAEGWRVLYCARSEPRFQRERVEWLQFDLSAPSLPADFGRGAAVLIHAAFATAPNGDSLPSNVSGARHLLEAARRNGISRRIFISSLASGAVSAYGKQKASIEDLFEGPGASIVRPGLVIGDGGLFRKLSEQLRRRAIVPLIDGGRQPMQTVLDDDLGEAVARIARQRLTGIFSIAESVPVEYRVFWNELAVQMAVPLRFVAVPFGLADMGVRLAEKLRVPLPVNRERLLGLAAMRPQEVTSDERVVGAGLRTYDQSIAIALGKMRANRARVPGSPNGANC